jgi:hypothetical protein
MSVNLLSVSQLTYIGNIVEFCLDRVLVRDLKNDKSIVVEGFIESNNGL